MMEPVADATQLQISINQQASTIALLTVTWNVGNAPPDPNQLHHIIPNRAKNIDLIAVGTQENEYKKAAARTSTAHPDNSDAEDDPDADDLVVPPSTSNSDGTASADAKCGPWEAMLLEHLGASWGVAKLTTLGEMRLVVFARAEELAAGGAISGVESARSATGIAHVYGNKGGLAVKLNYHHTSLVFVSTHLAAHDQHVKSRNAMCQEVLRETKAIGCSRLDVVSEFDHAFWMGDLNYRVNANALPPAGPAVVAAPTFHVDIDSAATKVQAIFRGKKVRSNAAAAGSGHEKVAASTEKKKEHLRKWRHVKSFIDDSDWPSLLAADQLRAARDAGEAFAGFSEGDSAFSPTFKMRREPGFRYVEQRIQSYCDRVLWRSMPARAGALRQVRLVTCPDVSTSDHKPVVAEFTIRQSKPLIALDTTTMARNNRSIAIKSSSTKVPPQHQLPLIRLMDVKLTAAVSDHKALTDSQPFFYVYANPPTLFGNHKGKPPMSAPGKRVEPASADHAHEWTWEDSKLPLLRAHTASPIVDLSSSTMILSVYDEDIFSAPDPLGVVLVPLTPPDDEAAQSGSWRVRVEDEPLVYYNTTKGTGRLSCTIDIFLGEKAREAEGAAKALGVGTKARARQGPICCRIL